jgi:hypothetical protein
MVLFTFTKESAKHACPLDGKHIVPMSKEEEAFVLGVLFQYPDFNEARTEVFAPMVAEETFRGHAEYSKIHTMTEAKLRAFAKERGLHDNDATGVADFRAAQQFSSELRDTHGFPVSLFKLPGHSYEPGPAIRPGAANLLVDDDLLVMAGSELGVALVAEFGTIIASDASFKILVYGKIKLIVVSVSSHNSKLSTADHGRAVKERGHACFMALVTSERDDVQEVIALEIQAAVNQFLADKHKRHGLPGPPPVMDVKIFMSGE